MHKRVLKYSWILIVGTALLLSTAARAGKLPQGSVASSPAPGSPDPELAFDAAGTMLDGDGLQR